MGNRKRNTAILLIVAGLFLILDKTIGFFAIISLLLIVVGLYKIKSREEKQGYILLALGAFLILSQHILFLILIMIVILAYLHYSSKNKQDKRASFDRQNLLKSIKWHKDPWVLKSISFWSFIGEVKMDMTLAFPEEKDVTVYIQGVIGDIDIIVPEDYAVSINASVIVGEIDLGANKEAGFTNKVEWQSTHFDSSEQKVRIIIDLVVGDVDIKFL